MKDGDKFFVILMGLFVLFGLGGAVWMFVQEMLARAALPEEMRTPEMIQKHFDGSVCLNCDVMGFLFIFFSVISVAFLSLCWGAYRLSSKLASE